jgi:hypothetical protein
VKIIVVVEHDMVVEEKDKWILLLRHNMEYDLLLCIGIHIFCHAYWHNRAVTRTGVGWGVERKEGNGKIQVK